MECLSNDPRPERKRGVFLSSSALIELRKDFAKASFPMYLALKLGQFFGE